jgi:ACS family phthalate transporter-like MFS transporter
VCGIIGGPLSTSIMSHFDTVAGFHGWQWLFVLTGLPPILAGLFRLVLAGQSPGRRTLAQPG